MKQDYTVYWYHLPYHISPYIDGYIGITNNIERRHKEHFRNKNQTHFSHALNKYDKEIVQTILHKNLTILEANEIEYSYRPTLEIGWNHAIGGINTLKSVQSKSVTLYHKSNYVLSYTFTSSVEASKILQISEGRIRQAIYRKSTTYGYDGWAILHSTNTDRSKTLTIQEYRSKLNSTIPKNLPSIYKGKTNRWTKAEKEYLGTFHKGKTISQQQRDTVSRKNKANHPTCITITLQHKDDSKEYSFHSISEASRQLDIPLSRLKSKAQRPLNRYGKDGWAITNLGS